jgi:hypothetical protein
MSRYERHAYFEQLVALKLRPMGDDDRRAVISIDDAVIYAEAVMLATELELAEACPEATADPAGEATPAATTANAAAADHDAPAPTTTTDRARRSRRLMDGWFGPARGSTPTPDEGA